MTERAPEWWCQALADFGADMGFSDTDRWNCDVLNLTVDDARYLIDIERSGNDIVLAVLRHAPLPDVAASSRLLLEATSFEHDHPFFLQAGLKGDNLLVLAARVERAQARRLYSAFELIRRLYADMGL